MNELCIKCGKHEHHAKGLCNRCYGRQYYHNNIEKVRAYRKKERVKNKTKIKLRRQKWYYKNIDKCKNVSDKSRRKRGILPMSENRECSCYLGIHVAECVLGNVFKNVVRQPYGTPGFDFICNHGKRIDVKSSCIRNRKRGKLYWDFNIRKNKIADYFLCLAFDNREDLNPLHLWLIPGDDVNNQIMISSSINKISKWDKYALDVDKVSKCCDVMKGVYS